MQKVEGDEEVLDTLLIYLRKNFPRLRFRYKIPLSELFPEPESKWLKGFWNHNSHADIAVFKHAKLVCIIEPGGWFHARDDRQKLRDLKKDKICELNKVNCLRIYNNTIEKFFDTSIPPYNVRPNIFKRLLKRCFYMVRRG